MVNVSASARLDTAQREGKRPQLPAWLEGSQGLNDALGWAGQGNQDWREEGVQPFPEQL